MIFLFQRIIQNRFQWTRPSPERLGPSGEGKYVQVNGFGFEDWNFNKNMLINGSIYGYCYYSPTENKRNETFNIAFATYINKQWSLIGFYLNCEFVRNPPFRNEVLIQKMHDLQQLRTSLGFEWQNQNEEGFIQKLKSMAGELKWRVSPDNAIKTSQPIAIPKKIFDTKNFRIAKPTELSETVFLSLYSLAMEDIANYDYFYDSEYNEGKEIERIHRLRERNQTVMKSVKDLFKQRNGKLYCQICGFDFYNKYGEIGCDFIEGHHTVPLSDLIGEVKTKVEDIALVCSNCHRMLHRKRPWETVEDLKKIINENT